MVATPTRGPDIIKGLRDAARFRGFDVDDSEAIGMVSSFCKDAHVETNHGRKGRDGREVLDIVATLTTDDIDADQERVLTQGIDLDTYLLKNRNAFVDHEYDMLSCVGKFRYINRKAHSLECRVSMLNNPDNPLIKAVISLAEAGSCPMSIGFAKREGGAPTKDEEARYPGKAYLVRKCIAMEGSFTCMPANVSCQTGEIIYAEKQAAICREILSKSAVPQRLWGKFGLPTPSAKPCTIVVWKPEAACSNN